MPYFTDPAEAVQSIHDKRRDVATSPQDPVPVDAEMAQALAVEQATRDLADLNPCFRAAMAAHLGGAWVIATDLTGKPLADPTRDLGRLLDTWSEFPDAMAHAACGEAYGCLGLELAAGPGWGWLRAKLSPKPVRRYSPDGEELDDPRARDVGDHHGAALVLLEDRLPAPRATVTSFMGSGASAIDAAKRRAAPPTLTWLRWAWPADGVWEFPLGRKLAEDVRLATSLPYDGSLIEIDGIRYRVSGPSWATAQPMPAHVAEILGGRRQRH